jgi:hypothetical protein
VCSLESKPLFLPGQPPGSAVNFDE